MDPNDLIEAGNIDLNNRPVVKNKDGSISTVKSIGVNIDGSEVLLPTVSPDGKIWTDKEAVDNYYKTGQHLGKFKTVDASNAYAEMLHKQQEKQYAEPKTVNPWDGITDVVKQGATAVVNTVKKLMPWDGVDTRPKINNPTFHNPDRVDVSTEAKLREALVIQPHERMPDTRSKAANLADIEAEIRRAQKTGNKEAIRVLTEERKKYVR